MGMVKVIQDARWKNKNACREEVYFLGSLIFFIKSGDFVAVVNRYIEELENFGTFRR